MQNLQIYDMTFARLMMVKMIVMQMLIETKGLKSQSLNQSVD